MNQLFQIPDINKRAVLSFYKNAPNHLPTIFCKDLISQNLTTFVVSYILGKHILGRWF